MLLLGAIALFSYTQRQFATDLTHSASPLLREVATANRSFTPTDAATLEARLATTLAEQGHRYLWLQLALMAVTATAFGVGAAFFLRSRTTRPMAANTPQFTGTSTTR